MTYSQQLAQIIANLRYEDIPVPVIQKLKTCLLYGTTMSVTAADDRSLLEAVVQMHSAPGQAKTIVLPLQLRAADAAYVDAYRMCSRGQNDTFADIVAHPGCIVIPAVLAVAQECQASGREVLTALAAGYECLASIAAGAAASVVKNRFRATSVFGVFAAAAAVSKLLGLDAAKTAHALGLASQSSAGTMQCWGEGTPEWRLQVANAARGGVIAARLAQQGFPAASQALEGDSGLYATFAGKAVVAAPQWTWQTPTVVYKPLPGCLINQGPLYQLLTLQRQHHFVAEDVKSITVTLSPRNADYPGTKNYGPFDSPTGAIMSCAFMLATGLRDGTLKITDFDQHYGVGTIHDLSRCVIAQAAEGMSDWGSKVVVLLKNNTVLSDEITDLSRFAFEWDEAQSNLAAMTDEWPFADARVRYQALKGIVQHFENEPSVDGLIDQLRP